MKLKDLEYSSPLQSENDKKEYRAFTLENGLKVLLIHDPERKVDDGDDASESENEQMSDEEHQNDDSMEDDGSGAEDEEEMLEEDEEPPHKGKAKEGEKLAAAALSIRVGGFQDPEDLPGLSHFLEHMVFMGSEKYKSENEFDTFVKKHGGSSNAHTACEETVFVFDIQPRHFEGALDIFAHFFIAPLLLKDSMERELKAVDSEFEMAIPSDSVRKEQILQSVAVPGHPMGKFSWGNSKSIKLPDDPDGSLLNERLNEYRRLYYLANRMNLVLQSKHPLDDLEDMVRRIFSPVPSGPCPPGVDYSHLPPPFDVPEYNKIYRVAPVKDLTEVELRWTLPPLLTKYKTKPLQYISHLTGHEGEGSLMSYLRKKLWALELDSGTDESNDTAFNSTYSEFVLKITLTDEGFKHLEEVVEASISYISLVKKTGPEEWLFREIQLIDETSFRFLEESTPYDYVEHLVSNMHYYSPEDYIAGPHLISDYDPQLIKECLEYLRPERMNIMVLHKDYAQPGFTDRKEKWVGACFKVEDIPKDWLERLKCIGQVPDFHMPKPNLFLAKDFAVHLPENPVKYPEKLLDKSYGTLWFKQDSTFKVPKASLGVYLLSPLATAVPKNAAALDLLCIALQQDTTEELYPALLAQMEYSISSGDRGLVIKASGFNDKIDVLLAKIMEHFCSIEQRLSEPFFNVLVDQLRKKYKNALLKPSSLVKDARLGLLLRGRPLYTEKLKALNGLTRELLVQYIVDLRSSIYIQTLLQGNLVPAKAIEIFQMIHSSLSACLSFQNAAPRYEVYEIPLGETVCRFLGFNPTDSNCVNLNYYQAGQFSFTDASVLEALLWMMDEPAFNQLRTQEQLGYHVAVTMLNTHGVIGFSVCVYYQIFKFTPEHVNTRIETFLNQFDAFLSSMSPEDFQEHMMSLIKNKEKPFVSLDEEVSRHWDEILRGEFVFDRLEREIAILKNVTLKDIQGLYQRLFAFNGNKTFRKMAFEAIGRNLEEREAEKGIEYELHLLQGEKEKNFVQDYRGFQASLRLATDD